MKRLVLSLVAVMLFAGVANATVPRSGTGNVNPPVAGAAYTNLTKAGTLGAIAHIGQNVFKCVTNVSTFPAFQGEPAFLNIVSADGYSCNEYRATTQFELFEGIWYCNTTGGITIDACTSAGDPGIGWIQISGVANAYVSGEGTDITALDYLAPIIAGSSGHGAKTTTDTGPALYLKRGGAAPTSAGNDVIYPKSLAAKAQTTSAIQATSEVTKVYLGNTRGR